MENKIEEFLNEIDLNRSKLKTNVYLSEFAFLCIFRMIKSRSKAPY